MGVGRGEKVGVGDYGNKWEQEAAAAASPYIMHLSS